MKTNPPLIALLIFLATIAIYMTVVSPLSSALFKNRAALTEDELRLSAMQLGVTTQADVKNRIAELEATNALRRATWISPMLNSYAMRAKSFLDAMATESGLTGMEYSEGTFRALPVPKTQLPDVRTARRSVRMRAMGDYAAMASFLLRAERDLPMMCLQSMSVASPKNGPATADVQEIEMTFEWPYEGEVIK